MEHYVGLEVSVKETHFCVMDELGDVVARVTGSGLYYCIISPSSQLKLGSFVFSRA
jgi:hypothetical protein